MFGMRHHCIQFAVRPPTTAAQHVSCISLAATLAMDCSTALEQLQFSSCDVHQHCSELAVCIMAAKHLHHVTTATKGVTG